MEILHNSKLIHGNLDPSNILIFKDKQGLVILDAFIASKEREVKFIKRAKISRDYTYQSPEIIQNISTTSREGDNWSIGIILLEMCFCEVPFDIGGYLAITKEKIENLLRETKYSKELIEIIKSLLIDRKAILTIESGKFLKEGNQEKLKLCCFQNNNLMKKGIQKIILSSKV